MNVGELVNKLKEFDESLVVCIADVGECYNNPLEIEATDVAISERGFYKSNYILSGGKLAGGKFLKLGNDDE